MNLELYEKPGSLGNSRLKPRSWLALIPTRAGALTPTVPPDQRAGTFTTCSPCWRCTCDRGWVCNQRSPQCGGPRYLSVLGLLFLLQNTCKWRAHQNQWKPTLCTSQWIIYWQTSQWGCGGHRQILIHALTQFPFMMIICCTSCMHRPPDRPEEHHQRRRGKIHEESFKILPGMQLNLRR